MENALILIVEDEPQISRILCSYLEREGYRTVTAQDGEVALIHHQSLKPDLVLLDVGLPKRDGFSVLADLRARGMTPVIMTTARAEDLDKLSALRIGADDYVVKPFNPAEVVERVRAVLRRAQGTSPSRTISIGSLVVDLNAHAVLRRADDGSGLERLPLTPTEFQIFAHMARQPRRAFTRMELLDAASPDSDAYDRVVDSHLSKLRAKLNAVGCGDMIEPVRGVGYRLWPER